MDPFALILLVAFAALGLWLMVLARFSGRGYDQVDWKSSREIAERREALEAQDADQMLAAYNARRERRGERAVTLEELELGAGRGGVESGPPRAPGLDLRSGRSSTQARPQADEQSSRRLLS